MRARITRVVDATRIYTPRVWDRQRGERRRRIRQGIALTSSGKVPRSDAETAESVRRFADAEVARYLARKAG